MPVTAHRIAMVNVPQPLHTSGDWLDDFMSLTATVVSPEIFRTWAAITMISGALERRVWTRTGSGKIYPNIFGVLVAPPGIGKSNIIDLAEQMMLRSKKFAMAPKDVTRSSLIDALGKASVRRIIQSGPHSGTLVEYNSIFVTASELGVFLPAYDTGFLSVLNYIFDNPPSYTQERRTAGLEINIVNPQMTILAGTQPGFLASLLPEEAWTMGTTSRLLMIYSTVSPKLNFWDERAALEDRPEYTGLVRRLAGLSELYGEFQWSREAKAAMWDWYESGCQPVPTHSRLQHYLPRRHFFVFKLAMVASAMRGHSLIVEESDFVRARDWLLWAETQMPNIFRDMAGRSDGQVMQELHFFAWGLYAKERKPVHENRLFGFLSTKVPAEKIQKILEIAERSNMFSREAGTPLYTPLPKHLHGEE